MQARHEINAPLLQILALGDDTSPGVNAKLSSFLLDLQNGDSTSPKRVGAILLDFFEFPKDLVQSVIGTHVNSV